MSNSLSDVSSRGVNALGSEPKKNVEKIDYATAFPLPLTHCADVTQSGGDEQTFGAK